MQIVINRDNRTDRKPFRWTDRNERRCEDVLAIVEKFDDWKPLDLRFIYYKMLEGPLAQEHWMWGGKPIQAVPEALGKLVKWMRIDGRLAWKDITDEHRMVHYYQRFEDADHFLNQELDSFLKGYQKCTAEGQPRYIEIWLEKHTLLHIIQSIGEQYCRRIVVCRGYNSFTFQTEFYKRAIEAQSRGQIPTVLYLGDWDPSGENMLRAAIQTIQEELGLDGVEYHRIGINPEHFDMIMADPVPVKPTDTRSKNFVKKYGATCYELNAFDPKQLRDITEDGILDFTDMEIYEQNLFLGATDTKRIKRLRHDVIGTIEHAFEKF